MRKYFIYGLVISLVIAGLLGIGVLLSGTFSELQVRILITTLAFTFYSIIGLCCNTIISSQHATFAKVGIVVTLVGLAYAVFTTWLTPDAEDFLQLRFSLLVIGICFAHCSLMLLIQPQNKTIYVVRSIAIAASVIATVIIVSMISTMEWGANNFRLLGMAAIVGIVATIVAPILAVTEKNASQRHS